MQQYQQEEQEEDATSGFVSQAMSSCGTNNMKFLIRTVFASILMLDLIIQMNR